MSRIDADDELAERIVRHSELELFAVACHWWIFPLPPLRLLLQAGADFQSSLVYRRMAFGPFNRQEFGQELRGLAVGSMLPKRAVSSMSSGVARSGQIPSRTVNAMRVWGKTTLAKHPSWILNLDGSEHNADVPRRIILDGPKARARWANSMGKRIDRELLFHSEVLELAPDPLAVIHR